MQIIHTPAYERLETKNSGFKYAGLSILFSTDEKVSDNFADWEKKFINEMFDSF